MLLSVFWFVVDAHKWFKGPKVNIEHMMASNPDDKQVIEGQEGSDSGSGTGIASETIDAKKRNLDIA